MKRENVLLSLLAAGAALGAMALADPYEASADTGDLVTVDGSTFPLCGEEDCSDQPNQIGVWRDSDTGRDFLILGERTYPIER
ncbi:hypothetical protein SEA_REFUGE_88 [Mycobacterium phage Refuge]|uniref:Uncharacterized protein n=1 Tax=Mycobacterium phage Refuge TaxID=2517967 RepID=A0A482JEP8_9CAUD|nr:hypothetical protein KIV61_gp15 [Mycobacterium phage Refuge]QBP31105.1 hypothetical protein SEA_REFUGE_88 [Mycobacterium phage Refuge]